MSGCRVPPILSARTAINVVEFNDTTWIVAAIENCLEIGHLAEGKFAKRQTQGRLYRILCGSEEIEQIIVIPYHAPFKGPCILLITYSPKYIIINFAKLVDDVKGERATEWKTVVDVMALGSQNKLLDVSAWRSPLNAEWRFSERESKLSCHGCLSMSITNIFEPAVAKITVKNLRAEDTGKIWKTTYLATGSDEDELYAYFDGSQDEAGGLFVEIVCGGKKDRLPAPLSLKPEEDEHSDISLSHEKLYFLRGTEFHCYNLTTKEKNSVVLRVKDPNTSTPQWPLKKMRIRRTIDEEGRAADYVFIVDFDRIQAYKCVDGELKLNLVWDCDPGILVIKAWELIGNEYIIVTGTWGTTKINVSKVFSGATKPIECGSMHDFVDLNAENLKEVFVAGDRVLWIHNGRLAQALVKSTSLRKLAQAPNDFRSDAPGTYRGILAVNVSTKLVVLLHADGRVTYERFDLTSEDKPVEPPAIGFFGYVGGKVVLDVPNADGLFLQPPDVYRPADAGDNGDAALLENRMALVKHGFIKVSFVCHAQRAPKYELETWKFFWERGYVNDHMVKTAFLLIDDQEYFLALTQSGLLYGPSKGKGTWMPFTDTRAAQQPAFYDFVDMQCDYEKQQILLLMHGPYVLTCGWFLKDGRLLFHQLRFDGIPGLREAKYFLPHPAKRCLVFGWATAPRKEAGFTPVIYDYEAKSRLSSSPHDLDELHPAMYLSFGVHVDHDSNARLIVLKGNDEWSSLALVRDAVETIQPALIQHPMLKVVAAPYDALGFTLIAAIGVFRTTLLVYQPETELLTAANEHGGEKCHDGGLAMAQTKTVNGVRVAVAALILVGSGTMDVLELMIKGNVEDPSVPEVLILRRIRTCAPPSSEHIYIPQTSEMADGRFYLYYLEMVHSKVADCLCGCDEHWGYTRAGQWLMELGADLTCINRHEAVVMKEIKPKDSSFQMTVKRSPQTKLVDLEIYYAEQEYDNYLKYAYWNMDKIRFAFTKGVPHCKNFDYDGRTISFLDQENVVNVKVRSTDTARPMPPAFCKGPCYFLHQRGEEFVWVLAKKSDGTKNFFPTTGLMDDSCKKAKICPILLNHAVAHTLSCLRIIRVCSCLMTEQ